jgi:hypothetical protein
VFYKKPRYDFWFFYSGHFFPTIWSPKEAERIIGNHKEVVLIEKQTDESSLREMAKRLLTSFDDMITPDQNFMISVSSQCSSAGVKLSQASSR